MGPARLRDPARHPALEPPLSIGKCPELSSPGAPEKVERIASYLVQEFALFVAQPGPVFPFRAGCCLGLRWSDCSGGRANRGPPDVFLMINASSFEYSRRAERPRS